MTAILTTIGDKFAVLLDRATIDELGLTEGARLEVQVDRGELRISAADEDGRRERVLASARKMMEIHDSTFRKLAE